MDQVAATELAKQTQLASLELGDRVERDARRLRRRRELRLHEHDRLAHADDAAADRERSARRVRAAVRHDRQHRRRARGWLGSSAIAASSISSAARSDGCGRAIGPQDKTKIDEYLEAVRDVERRIQMAEEQNTRELPVVEQPVGIPTDYAEHAKLMMDLLALAYQTDLTRISTFMLAREVSGHAYPEIGVTDSHHPLSHHQDEPAKLERLHKINEYHFRQFAYLVDKLAEHARGGRHHARPHGVPLRHRDQRQQHALPRRPADRAGRRQGDRHQGRALRAPPEGHAAREPASSPCWTSWACRSRSSATAPAASPRSPCSVRL